MHIALSGPSGIGKGYIKERLLENVPSLAEISWLTTRALRPGEHPGGNRRHVPVDQFQSHVDAGECVLVQELYGNRYGVLRTDLAPCAEVRLTEIHPANVQSALSVNAGLICIGLVTDDLIMLRERMLTRQDGHLTFEDRLAAASMDMDLIRAQHVHFNLVAIITREPESTQRVISHIMALLAPKE